MMATRIDCGNFIRRDCIGKRVELGSPVGVWVGHSCPTAFDFPFWPTKSKAVGQECPTGTSEDARAYIARRNSTTWVSAQRPSLLPLAFAR